MIWRGEAHHQGEESKVKVCTAKLIPNELSARDDVKLVPNLVQN
jgi:hypothetical protein